MESFWIRLALETEANTTADFFSFGSLLFSDPVALGTKEELFFLAESLRAKADLQEPAAFCAIPDSFSVSAFLQ